MKRKRFLSYFTVLLLVVGDCLRAMPASAFGAPLAGPGVALAAPAVEHYVEAVAQTWSIAIEDAGFAPAVLTLTAGDQVEWHNATSQDQTLRSGTPTAAAPHLVYLPFVARDGGTSAGNAVTTAPSTAEADAFEVTLPPGGAFTHTFSTVGEHPYYLTNNPTHTGRIVVQAAGLPPDPGQVAPPLDPSVPTNFADATAFLYTGSDPIQTGVVSGTIEPRRVAVLRGVVLDRAGQPLPGVAISILDHPEFGQTLSRADGLFDLAVNGGGLLTVNYEKAGYLPAQRQVQAPWQDYAWLPDVVLIPLDSQVTTIDLSASIPMQVARGSAISDTRGVRQATLLFAQGTQAEMVLPNGLTRTLTTLNVRATEYTVEPNGPNAMPAELPANSGYTYAAEFSVDEALAAGATEVRFDRPVIAYLENFIGFPAGVLVPAGYYDRRLGQWVGMPDGLVVRVLSISGGQASLDIDGDDIADPAAALAQLGISSAELQRLAELYQPGQSLWRVPISHFTPCDWNWPFGPPADADYPSVPAPQVNPDHRPGQDDDCTESGSIIGCLSQTLGEAVDLTGTPFRLHYQSDRVLGRTGIRNLSIPVTGANVPASLVGVRLRAQVAGQRIDLTLPPQANQVFHYAWDGQDGYGRTVQGIQAVITRLDYTYNWEYVGTDTAARAAYFRSPAFGRNPGEVSDGGIAFDRVVAPGEPLALSMIWYGSMPLAGDMGSGGWDARGQGLGGWTLDVHHVYDPDAGVLYYGDGSQRSAQSVNMVIETVAGAVEDGNTCDGFPATQVALNSPGAVAVGPDGSYYVSDRDGHRICRVGPDGMATTIAGTGAPGFSGDGGPAPLAQLNYPEGLAIAPDGSLYIADNGNNRVRRVAPDGIISTVAGTGVGGYSGDGGLATQAQLTPDGVAVGPDGHVYIAGNDRVRRVAPDGYITTMAGTGIGGYSGDGGLSAQAQLDGPQRVAVDGNGMVYIADTQNHRIRRVTPSGIITTVAGSGVPGFGGDGGPATLAHLTAPTGIALGPDGSLYIADTDNGRVRRVQPSGVITTIAGTGGCCSGGDKGPATQAYLGSIHGLAISPDGSLYLADSYRDVIRRVALPVPSLGEDLTIPSEDGTQVFQFDVKGRHLRTLNALTGAVQYWFSYDSAGRLAEVHDGDGNVTTIFRDANGNPTHIVGPYGHTTALALDANGYLASITRPAGDVTQFDYTANGLLTRLTDPRGGIYQFAYDAWGRLVRDQDPAGGVKTLALVEAASGYTVTLTTATTAGGGWRRKCRGAPSGATTTNPPLA